MKARVAVFLVLTMGSLFASDMLPERILSGYYGYNVTRKGDHEHNLHMIDVLAANGFNSYEAKIQAGARHFDVAAHVPTIQLCCRPDWDAVEALRNYLENEQ